MKKKEIITAEGPGFKEKISEIIEYRDLFLALAYRDLMIKYVQTYLGLVWAAIQPLATIIIFTFVFGKLLNTATDGIPYPLFITVGMSVWNYFSVVMQQSGGAIINAQNMIQKIYFPRLILPLSKAFVGLTDLAIGLLFLAVVMFYYQFLPGWQIIFYPLIILWLIITSVGVGIWLSSITVKYRDFNYILPYLVQFGLYATPVGYSFTNIQSSYEPFFYLNPVTGIIEMARWSLLKGEVLSPYIFISLAVSLLLFGTSIWHFGRTESKMADLL